MAGESKRVQTPPVSPFEMLTPLKWSVAASLFWVAPQKNPTLITALFKVSPILCLMQVVLNKEELTRKTVLILLSIISSLIGDYYLLWPQTNFVEGVIAFWVTQVIYIISFGFKKVSWKNGIAVYGINLLALILALGFIPSPPERIAVTFYSLTITTMLWRAIDRAQLDTDILWQRRKYGAAGAVVFCVSDLCIAVLQEGKMIPHLPAQLIILSTYYLAQVLIVLSLCEDFWKV